MEASPGAAAEGSTEEVGGAEQNVIRVPSHPSEEEVSSETFADQGELDSFSPKSGDMEQPITDRESSALTSSGALLQTSALSVEVKSSTESAEWGPGDTGEPVSLPLESAFGQLGQLTNERGEQRWEREHQQHGDEEHKTSGSEETIEKTQLIVLDAEHPLMQRFQAALKNDLTKQIEEVNLELQELRTAVEKRKAEKEELGVILSEEQQQLAQLQVEVEKNRECCSQTATARRQLEEELEGLRLTYKKLCQTRVEEREKVSALEAQAENLALHLFYMQNMEQAMHRDILLMKQTTKKAEAQKIQAEMEKKKQDFLEDRLTRKAYELQEQISMLEAQLVAQAEKTNVTRRAVNEARMETQAINMEKKQLISHWNSSLIALKQRDEAYIAAQELLSKYRHDLKSLEMDIEGCRKAIRKEEEENELLVSTLSRLQNHNNTTKKLIAQCLSKQEALKVECGIYAGILQETEETLNRTKMERAALLNESLTLSRDIQKETDAIEQIENEIMAKLQEQTMSSKAAKHFSQLAAKLRHRKTDLEMQRSKVENDIAQVVQNTIQINCRLTVLQNTLCELDKEIKNVKDLISCKEREIAKCNLLTEKKRRVLREYKKKLEVILSQQEGQELRPLEIEINGLTKEIEEYSQKIATLQKNWLDLQKELVKLTYEREERTASLDSLKKQVTIMQQKKVRTENEIQQEKKEQEDIKRHMKNMTNDVAKLNVLINKSNSSFEELHHGNIITQNEFARSLKAAEKEFLEKQEKYSQLTKENERLRKTLLEAEQEIMLWEKKIQLAKEMRADSEKRRGEIQAMKAEIRRKQVRYGQLMKQQQKLIRDTEACVSRREMIAVRGETQKKTEKKHTTKSDFLRKKQELKKHISETQKNIQDCDKTILELESTQASLCAAFSKKQEELCRVQAECDGLDSEVKLLRLKKLWNLLEIVALQTRQKHLQALKEGKYIPLCRTEEARRKKQQKLLDRLRTIKAIVQQIQQEHPQHQKTLQWFSQCLESRLSSQKD